MHGVQPGPLKTTSAVAVSKPVPATVNVNTCWLMGGLGEVVIVLICGAVPLGFDTVSVAVFEAVPAPF